MQILKTMSRSSEQHVFDTVHKIILAPNIYGIFMHFA